MSFLGLVPPISLPPTEPRAIDELFLAERFVHKLHIRLTEMQRDLADDEQLDVVAFLPSGKAILVEAVSYDNPSLVMLQGREQDNGRPSTLLVHLASLQILVSIEPIPSGQSRKSIVFRVR